MYISILLQVQGHNYVYSIDRFSEKQTELYLQTVSTFAELPGAQNNRLFKQTSFSQNFEESLSKKTVMLRT
jgi:hypothetical protein